MMPRNTIIKKEGWTISFLPSQDPLVNSLAPAIEYKVPLDESETAIFSDEPGPMLILRGNWTHLYGELNTFEEAKALFKENKEEYRSQWSEDVPYDH